MAGTILFYRGTSEATLPAKKDGSIFVIASDLIGTNTDDNSVVQYERYGDMYVDISDTERLHIKPNDAIYVTSKSELSDGGRLYGKTSALGKVFFIYDDQITDDGSMIPHIIVGDGVTNYNQLPDYTVVTQTTAENIQSKVNIESEHIEGKDYRICFSTG